MSCAMSGFPCCSSAAAGKPSPRPEPKPTPAPEPKPVEPAAVIPAAHESDDSDPATEARVVALVDAQPDAENAQPTVSAQPTELAAQADMPAPADADPDTHAAGDPDTEDRRPKTEHPTPNTQPSSPQDTAGLPATGQDRDVLPTPIDEESAAPESGLRWAAMAAAARDAGRPDLVGQEILVWNSQTGEWERALLFVPFDFPEADAASDLAEPGAEPQELPLWERLFARWEKAFADRRRQQEPPCPPTASATL